MGWSLSKKERVIPVILAGGIGSRLWPLSSRNSPKQFLPLLSNNSLFQETVTRLFKCPNVKSPVVICNKDHKELITKQLGRAEKQIKQIIVEPVGRNTAPAIAVLAIHYLATGFDPLLLVIPSDHFIANHIEFYKSINLGCEYAASGKLVAFGVKPTRAETGYGYIKFSQGLQQESVYKIERFIEKPIYEVAKEYVSSGQYYWNSGMFMFRASTFIEELQEYASDIFECCKVVAQNLHIDGKFINLPENEFANCPANSIDYAIMEHTKKGVMVSFDEEWSDVGVWSSLLEYGNIDVSGNVTKGDTVLDNVRGSYIHASSRKIVAIGVKDHVVVETKDAVLVVHKNSCQRLKEIVDQYGLGEELK